MDNRRQVNADKCVNIPPGGMPLGVWGGWPGRDRHVGTAVAVNQPIRRFEANDGTDLTTRLGSRVSPQPRV